MFYSFAQDLFNVWLKASVASHPPLHLICCGKLVWLKYMQKIQPHADM